MNSTMLLEFSSILDIRMKRLIINAIGHDENNKRKALQTACL